MRPLGKYLCLRYSYPALTRFRSAFAVGVVANVYARFFSGNAFVVMVGPFVRVRRSLTDTEDRLRAFSSNFPPVLGMAVCSRSPRSRSLAQARPTCPASRRHCSSSRCQSGSRLDWASRSSSCTPSSPAGGAAAYSACDGRPLRHQPQHTIYLSSLASSYPLWARMSLYKTPRPNLPAVY